MSWIFQHTLILFPDFIQTWQRDLVLWVRKSSFLCLILLSCQRTPCHQGKCKPVQTQTNSKTSQTVHNLCLEIKALQKCYLRSELSPNIFFFCLLLQSAGAAEAFVSSTEGPRIWSQAREHVAHVPAVISVQSHATLSWWHEEGGETHNSVYSPAATVLLQQPSQHDL